LPPNLVPSLEWVAIGLLILIFLWFRPQGILPERKRVIRPPFAAVDSGSAGKEVGGRAVAGWRSSAPAVAVVSEAGPEEGDGAERDARGSAGRPAPQDSGSTTAQGPVAGSPDGAGEKIETAAGGEPAGSGSVVLEAVSLSREFGGVRAVDGVSFEVRKGTLTGLIGPNGAGKSTLLAMLAGTLGVTSGKVVYQGNDVTGLPAYRRARMGLIRTFQLASEFKRLTVMENLISSVQGNRGDSLRGALVGPRYWRRDEDAAVSRAEALLERFGLAQHANTYAGDLSGGQRRLVEIMRALMAGPQVLLLDEPMAGVHPHLARRIGNELVGLCAEGMTILMVEHELAIMDEFCDPVVVMAEGSVLAEGTMEQLRGRQEVVEAYLVG
jgi:ABC-type branched-subunit amino acid transport system ATPase component